MERPTRFGTRSTSRTSADVDPISISLRENDDGSTTRRLLVPMIVENPNVPEATVKIELRHQRRNRRTGEWEDADSFDLRHLEPGQEIRLDLNSTETLQVFRSLRQLYEIGGRGVPFGESTMIVADADEATLLVGRERQVVAQLIAQNGAELWDLIESIEPDLLTAAHAARLRRERMAAVEEFEAHMTAGDWSEGDWKTFFESNPWIFGSGLAYQFLSPVQDQPHYGGTTVTGRGAQRGDHMLATAADVRFSVLVEIKRPDTELVEHEYRNGVYELGEHVTGGVSQVQVNCRTWTIEGSRTEANVELMREAGVETVQPKGILVIGRTSQLDEPAKVRTFELFRQNLTNPEIVTFDELLERARYIAGGSDPTVRSDSGRDPSGPHVVDDPF